MCWFTNLSYLTISSISKARLHHMGNDKFWADVYLCIWLADNTLVHMHSEVCTLSLDENIPSLEDILLISSYVWCINIRYLKYFNTFVIR